jgi:hypothetical protein
VAKISQPHCQNSNRNSQAAEEKKQGIAMFTLDNNNNFNCQTQKTSK